MLQPQRVLVALATGCVLVAGCGKPAPPKVDAAGEAAEAQKRAQARDYGGNAMKALEAAKGLEGDMNKKAEEAVARAEK